MKYKKTLEIQWVSNMAAPVVAGMAAMGMAEGTAKKLTETLKKIKGLLEKASPAFKQSMEIFQKSILLFLRPIGDIFSKLMRPFLILFLKLGILWYKMLTPKGN